MLTLWFANESGMGASTKKVSYDEFQKYVRSGYIEQVVGYDDNSVEATVKRESVAQVFGADSSRVGQSPMIFTEAPSRESLGDFVVEVGKVFDTDKTVISYENLGIGRLVYQLPTTLCEIFLQEVFKKGSIETLDHETLMTVQAFFENNLNVSETSRKLFVHRNTLVYRLEKIKKITGLDLREFDHAIVFKVALMVKKYLNSQGEKY